MSHYYTKEQETPFHITKIHAVLNGKEYEFFTAPGVFSKDKVDFGHKSLQTPSGRLSKNTKPSGLIFSLFFRRRHCRSQ